MKYTDPSFNILEAALERQYGLPTGLMAGIRTRGEKSNSDQTSPKGAKGVYQFIPATWRQFADPGTNPTDAEAAAVAAARYLRYGLDKYKDVAAAVAEYNGGPKAALAQLRTGDAGNNETRAYVARVMEGFGNTAPPIQPLPLVEEPPSVLGDAGYTSENSTPPTAFEEFAPADIANVDLNVPLEYLDPSIAADIELERQIGQIVDEVFNG